MLLRGALPRAAVQGSRRALNLGCVQHARCFSSADLDFTTHVFDKQAYEVRRHTNANANATHNTRLQRARQGGSLGAREPGREGNK